MRRLLAIALAVMATSALAQFGGFRTDQPFFGASGSGVAAASFPTGCVMQLEPGPSASVITNGSELRVWQDMSGNQNNMTNFSQSPSVLVEYNMTPNGKTAAHFGGYAGPPSGTGPRLQCAPFATTNFSGLDIWVVMKNKHDPSRAGGFNGPVFMLTCFNTTYNNHTPYDTGNWYSMEGANAQFNMGNPTTSVSNAFRIYNVAVSGSGTSYNAWIDTECFYTNTSYTFSTTNAAVAVRMGYGTTTANNYFYEGYVAAAYVFNRRLTDTERTYMRWYCKTNMGLAISL